MLSTSPCETGSSPVAKTMGMVVVAALAAKAETVPPAATIMVTWRRTNSAASAGSLLSSFSAQRYSIVTFPPSTWPVSFRPWRNARRRSAKVSADAEWRNPITGIAGCCARAASGHVAALPRSVMNSRRFIVAIIRSPRRRGRATSDEPCESLKINMFRVPCGLVAAWAAQHERFEGGHTAVWTRYVVVGDLDRREVAALRPGIDGECGEAVGVGRVSHRRPGRVLLHVDRRTLACCRVGFADGGDHATLRRVEKQLVRWQGRSAAADHHVHRSFSGVDHVGGSARRYRRQSEI